MDTPNLAPSHLYDLRDKIETSFVYSSTLLSNIKKLNEKYKGFLLGQGRMSLVSKLLHQNSLSKTSCTSTTRALCLLMICALKGQLGLAKQIRQVRSSRTLWGPFFGKPLGTGYSGTWDEASHIGDAVCVQA